MLGSLFRGSPPTKVLSFVITVCTSFDEFPANETKEVYLPAKVPYPTVTFEGSVSSSWNTAVPFVFNLMFPSVRSTISNEVSISQHCHLESDHSCSIIEKHHENNLMDSVDT